VEMGEVVVGGVVGVMWEGLVVGAWYSGPVFEY
jgi:hypothetical protein